MLLCVNLCGEIVEAMRLAREGKGEGGEEKGEGEDERLCSCGG
jgi:hypothetical protein